MIAQQIVVVKQIDKSLQFNNKYVKMPFTLSFVLLPQFHDKAIFGHSYPVKVGINKSKKLRLTAYHFNCLPFLRDKYILLIKAFQ